MEVRKRANRGQAFINHYKRHVCCRELVEQYLYITLSSLEIGNKCEKLMDSMRYSLLGDGKKIRAVLLLEKS